MPDRTEWTNFFSTIFFGALYLTLFAALIYGIAVILNEPMKVPPRLYEQLGIEESAS